MKTTAKTKQVNWIPLPDPLPEDQVKLELAWSADERTRTAIERQAALMGFASPTAYLHQALAALKSEPASADIKCQNEAGLA